MTKQLFHRLLAHWPTKLWLGTLLTFVFGCGYFAIQYFSWRPAIQLELTGIDRAIAFAPPWTWVYQSVYLLFPLAWLCESKEQLRRYAAGFVAVMLIGFTCFVLWPVAGPRPTMLPDELPDDAFYRWLISYDTPLNSFPSLHVAWATYSACVAIAVTDGALRHWLCFALPPWVALIAYATLATKQHYFIDLPPGIALGWLAQRWAWRRAQGKKHVVPPSGGIATIARDIPPEGGTTCLAPAAHEFPDWPRGWYVAARSAELSHQPMSLELFGRRLVGYRTLDGRPIVMDARCWHLGANLAQGCVIGEQIVCPFHGWRYGADGACELIPAQAEIPHGARQQTFATTERAGLVFVFPAAVAAYPLPFFDGTAPHELIAAPPFEFELACPWWLVGTNGFDLQHFAVAHDRKLMSTPTVTEPHPSARRITARFEVCGANWRDRLTRCRAGRFVTMDTTMWSGTLAFVQAHFHDDPDNVTPRTTSYGMTEIRPLAPERTLVRITIWRQRRKGWRALDQLDVRIKRHFIRAFLKPDTQLLNEVRYHPARLIEADGQMIDYLRWLARASQ